MLTPTSVLSVVFAVLCFGTASCSRQLIDAKDDIIAKREALRPLPIDASNDIPILYSGKTGKKYIGEADKIYDFSTPFYCAMHCYFDEKCRVWQVFYGSDLCKLFYYVPDYKYSMSYINWRLKKATGDAPSAAIPPHDADMVDGVATNANEEADIQSVYPADLGIMFVDKPSQEFYFITPFKCAKRCYNHYKCQAWQMFYGSNICEIFFFPPEENYSEAYVYGKYPAKLA